MTYAVGKGLNKWVEFVIGLAEMFLRVSCSIQELPPHGIQRQSTVQIARVSNTLYPQCLPHHTLPVRWFHSHNSDLFQVDSVVLIPRVGWNAVLIVLPSDRSFMFHQSLFQVSLRFANIYLFTVETGYFVHYASLQYIRSGCLHSCQLLP